MSLYEMPKQNLTAILNHQSRRTHERSPHLYVEPDFPLLNRDLASYREPDVARSVFELLMTAIPFVLLWILIWAALDAGYWIGLILVIPAAGLLVRLFMIQHDCGHGSFFRRRSVNDWVGRAISVLTLTPYDFWRRCHALHHASSGNLDHRGIGDIDTLTVREYLALPGWRQLLYRMYRHPTVMFGIGPAYLFILHHRLPMALMRSGWQPWASTMATNVAISILAAAMMWLIGVEPFLLVQLPITLLASSAGVWLFYVQHQFENTAWDRDVDWTFQEAALHGSSHYDLPKVLRWFTANIGVHHVHHLSSRIPYYRLPQVLRDRPQLAAVGRISLLQSLRCVRMVLWDERRRRLISFRAVDRLLPRRETNVTWPQVRERYEASAFRRIMSRCGEVGGSAWPDEVSAMRGTSLIPRESDRMQLGLEHGRR
jgi:omega-6 fatty acid desaturase (delta-12 desaturase)